MNGRGRVVRGYILVIAVYAFGIPLLIAALAPRVDRALGLGPLLPPSVHVWAGLAALAYAWFWIGWALAALVRRGGGHPNEILGRELGPVTRRVVTDGPYRRTRNPMAFGLILFYFLALPLLLNSPVALALLPLACLFEVWYHRRYEEPGLLERFGADYERYRARVPLLLPFRRRRSG
ncbi:MAG: methyltransferase [bacterium]|nr:methyltransferase [bacterium]